MFDRDLFGRTLGEPEPLDQDPAATPDTDIIGRRIRFLEPPWVTERWWRYAPKEWFPRFGHMGTIVALPPAGEIGRGPQVRWDHTEHTTWLGSSSKFEFIS